MTTRNETASTEQQPSLWQKLVNWLIAFDEAANNTPQQYTYEKVSHLNHEIFRLNERLDQLEKTGSGSTN
jgi:ubiquinone biosynthesis protein UbiJ